MQVGIEAVTSLTPLDFVWFHVLSWHRVVLHDLRQCRGGKVLFARLLLCAVLPRVLLHRFEPVCSPSVFVMSFLEKLPRLFPHFKHPRWWQPEHLCYSCDLVVLGGPRKQREAKE